VITVRDAIGLTTTPYRDIHGGVVDQYFTHDANFNVTAIVGNTGTVVEGLDYDPFGKVTVLDASFANDADGISDFLFKSLPSTHPLGASPLFSPALAYTV
jgi:hypothetical protein